MYIKNHKFTDEDTLLEMLFDFGIGTPSPVMKLLIADIDKDLVANDAYNKYINSLEEQDDKDEVYAEERDLRLSEKLLEMYTSFEVKDAKLFGIANDNKELLYEIDLV